MLLPIRPICNPKKIRRDGTSLIQIQYCFSAEKKTLLNTGIAIPPACWNKKRLCISESLPSSIGNAGDLNNELKRMLRVVEDLVDFAVKRQISDRVNFVKKFFTPSFDIGDLEKQKPEVLQLEVNKDFFFQFDEYIKSKSGKVTPGMVKIYNYIKTRLKAFEVYRKKPITFDCIDYNFYEDMVDFFTYKYTHSRRSKTIIGLRMATIGTTVKQLRVFIKDRVRRKIIPPIDLTDFKILDEESDSIYLTWEEISRFYQVNLSACPDLIPYRNLFVLGCLTGLRFSDFSTIKAEDIRGGMLYKKQNKSDHWVVIPLREIAQEILVHYFKKKIPVVHNGIFNKCIKEIGCMAGIKAVIRFSHKRGNKDIVTVKPKYARITSHTCRRSFCTNEFLAGTPVELIMKISGHKSVKDFYKYIKITPEQAGQQIREIWEKRDCMKFPQ